MSGSGAQIFTEKGRRLAPVAFNEGDGHLELLSDLGGGHPAEEAQGDDLALALVELGQLLQGVVETKHVHAGFLKNFQYLVEGDALGSGAGLDGLALPG